MSDPFGSVEFNAGSATLVPEIDDNSPTENMNASPVAIATSDHPIADSTEDSTAVDDLLGDFNPKEDVPQMSESSGQGFGLQNDNVSEKNNDFDLLNDFQPQAQQPEESHYLGEPESTEDHSPAFGEEEMPPSPSDPSEFETNEATPPPSPPPTPIEQSPPAPIDDPVRYSVISSPLVDTTSTLTPDDGPVKMPKATTISQPTKAPRSSSSSSGSVSAWLRQLDPRVSEILLWRDPRLTGMVLGVILLVLLSISRCSIFSVVSYLLLLAMIATISTRIIKIILVKVHKGDDVHPFKDVLEADMVLSEELVEEYAQAFVQKLNPLISSIRDLVLVREFLSSLKFCFVLYTLTYIGAWLNGLTVVILATVGAFTLPKVYEVNKAQIDQYVDVALAKFDDYYKQLEEKIPYLKKQKTQ